MRFVDNGPGVLEYVLQTRCNLAPINRMNEDNCDGFRVYPPQKFYPLPYAAWTYYFINSSIVPAEMQKLVNEATVIHVWNYLSKDRRLVPRDDSIYTLQGFEHCPDTFQCCDYW